MLAIRASFVEQMDETQIYHVEYLFRISPGSIPLDVLPANGYTLSRSATNALLYIRKL